MRSLPSVTRVSCSASQRFSNPREAPDKPDRARAGSLLAFTAVLVAISAGSAQRGAPSLTQASGTVLVLASAVLFLFVSLGEGLRYAPSRRTLAQSDVRAPVQETHERLLRGTLDVLDSNQRILNRRRALSSAGLLCLVAGTILIGARVTGLLLQEPRMKTSSRDADAYRGDPSWDQPIGPPESPSGLGDIPGLPPYDRESITYELSGFALIWGYVRQSFRRRPRDRAA